MAGKTKGEDKEHKEDKEDKNKDEEDWRRRQLQKRICRRAVESVQPHTAMCICTSRGKGQIFNFSVESS